MKKKISLLMVAVITAAMGNVPAYAVESVDFSDKLTELKTLMDECKDAGIPTDYELINYVTIERFEDYINQDIANGMTNTDYTIGCVDALYAESKSNLEAYLNGSKEALSVNRPDMHNLKINGSNIYDGNKPVFSTGYGYFTAAINDMPNFHDFGMNNIQFELGPTSTRTSSNGWTESPAGDVQATGGVVDTEYHSGSHSFKIENNTPLTPNVYIRYHRTIDCKPNTTYKFGCWTKGETLKNVWLSINGFDNRNHFGQSSDWVKNEFEYTTTESQTVLDMTLLSEDEGIVYLDDFYVYESGKEDVNLVVNPGLEEDVYPSVETLKNNLQTAKDNNLAVSLLLSPHYFPEGLSSDVYTDQGTFIHYNINASEAKAIVEDHIRVVLSRVKDYDCIDSICISNEPWFDTRWFADFYNPLFRQYLQSVYGTIDKLNSACGTSYSDFSKISMPTTLKDPVLGSPDKMRYDWIEFNDKVFADWHKWMAGIVEEYMPGTPVHSKVMDNFTTDEPGERTELARGTDFELFGEFSDYAGNDGGTYYDEGADGYYRMMFFYDFLNSAVGKPVYNSEEHIIRDRNTDFTDEQTTYVLNNMWQGAIHGRSLSTIWVWDRSYDTSSDFWGSIQFRPDAVAGLGKTSLDFLRLSDEIAEIQNDSEKIAIYYSKPSRLYTDGHTAYLLNAYKGITAKGYDVGVVTDKSIGKLSEYNTLVIPYATHCKAETLTAIENFIKNGGKVYYSQDTGLFKDEILSGDEHDKSLDNSYVLNNSTSFTDIKSVLPSGAVTLKDANGAEVSNLDWQYSVTEDRILINATNMAGYGDVKNVSVYYNGEKLEGLTELISNTDNLSTVELNGHEPKLLQYILKVYEPTAINDVYVDTENSKIVWDVVGTDYVGMNIYFYGSSKKVEYLGQFTGSEYAYTQEGMYIIRAVNADGTEVESKNITVVNDGSFEIEVISAKAGDVRANIKNNTGNYLYGKAIVEFIGADGNVLAYGYGKTFIQSKNNHELHVSVSAPAGVTTARITVYDIEDNCIVTKDINL